MLISDHALGLRVGLVPMSTGTGLLPRYSFTPGRDSIRFIHSLILGYSSNTVETTRRLRSNW